MTFDEALDALLGFVGRDVTVKVTHQPMGEAPLTLAFIHGKLERAVDRGPALMPEVNAPAEVWSEHDAHFFVLSADQETGFYVSPQAFRDAIWLAGHSLRIEHGPDIFLGLVTAPPGPGPSG